ncbi:SusC/RagA family TonB-linked outer membrane protein [Flavihumibacter sp. UBA7668]|uniref:SusC/RagA family TonB-linked outer membrane protein n=1 Tax=Flavihumibacter sp. UBA7668 TaxID=1946542 RepID=UPI0025C13D58|nr:SusC/RagA family TonB-linked outer membrane protein [Flavihumibacter sp. UBA7668]
MRKVLGYWLPVLIGLVLPLLAAAQQTVKGRITDPAGNPLQGATIAVKGAKVSTQSDGNGDFSIVVPSGSNRLEISFVGYLTQTVSAKSGEISVQLKEDDTNLNEVVVTGLATTIKKSNAANSVARISAKELTGSTRPPTLDGAISGKIPGAQITANSGAPGGGVSIRLRGVSTVAGSSQPLFVIDGVIVNNDQFATGTGTRAFTGATSLDAGTQDQAPNRIADINPADIESVEVLKGPSASAIYGSRAGAGVIVITTKRGKSGNARITINQDAGITRASKFLGSSNWSEEKIETYGGAYNISEEDALDLFAAANGRTWDYEKMIWGNTGKINNTSLNISGGNDRTKYYIAGSYQNETGIQKKTGFTRKSFRINLDHKLNDRIDFKVSSNFINSYASRGFTGNDNRGVSLTYHLPYIPNFLDIARRPDGTYPTVPGRVQNPMEIIDRAQNIEKTNRFLNSGEMNVKLFSKGKSTLKLGLRGGVDFLVSEPTVYMPEDLQMMQESALRGAIRLTTNKSRYTYMQAGLNFNTTVGNNVELTTGLVFLRDDQRTDQSYIQGEGLLPAQRNPSIAQRVTTGNIINRSSVVAFDASQEFNWDDKVIGRVGLRADKSTLSGLNFDKYYYYPRAAVAVNLANFGLWESDIITQVKPRAAYGEASGFPSFDAVYSNLLGVNYGGELGSVSPILLGLGALDPERAQEIEFGLDLGFLQNRITLEATWYNKKVKDFLFPYTLAPGTGVSSIKLFPVGDLENKGIEIGLNAQIIKRSSLEWTSSLQYWNNRTEVTRLNIPPSYVANSGFGTYGRKRIVLGTSPTAWWGVDTSGNTISYKDFQPDFQMSWNNNIRFAKNFDFNMLWHASQGGYNASLTRLLKDEGGTTKDWSVIGKSGDPLGIERQGSEVTNFVFDASYIRLRELGLYYTVPAKILKSGLGKVVQNLRVGVSAQNLVTITDYYGYDPEVSNFNTGNAGGALTGGVDLAPFPLAKRYFFHLNIGL